MACGTLSSCCLRTFVLLVLYLKSTACFCPHEQLGACCKDDSLIGYYDYEIHCPFISSKFNVAVKENSSVKVTCPGHTRYQDILELWQPSDLKFKIGAVNQLEMSNCPLPESSLQDFIENILGATGVKALTVRYARGTLKSFHLANFTQLAYLSLLGMSSEQVDAEFFQDLSNLQHLEIKSLRINQDGSSILSNDAFRGLKKLKKLELDNNGLEELSPDLFTNLTSLQTINLHNNKLTQLPPALFTGLANLTSLTLTENRLTSLPAGLFDPLVSLEVIKMGENVYEQFPENLFSKTTKLKSIDMTVNHDRCSIGNRPNSNYYTKLNIELCADKVTKMDFPETFFQIPSLESLKMVYFPVNSFPPQVFKGAINLVNLTIQQTFSGNFPGSIFKDCKKLKNLDLAGNLIKELPDGIFSGLQNLANLELHFNSITELTEKVFADLDNLRNLTIKGNLVSKIHQKALKPLKLLEELDLSDNSLFYSGEMNDRSMKYLTEGVFEKLDVLNLSNNSLSAIEGSIVNNFLGLTKLDLSHNSFRDFIASEHSFTKYKNMLLDLSYNQIESVNFEGHRLNQNSNVENVVNLKLEGNPILCDCFMTEMKQVIDGTLHNDPGKKYKIDHPERVICSKFSPALSVVGKSITKVDYSELICPFPSKKLPNDPCPKRCFCNWNRKENLIIVNCVNQSRTSIPDCLPGLDSVRGEKFFSLELAGNNILQLPDFNKKNHTARGFGKCLNLTGKYDQIKSLNLSKNQLLNLDTRSLPASLTNLDLSWNSLQKLSDIDIDDLNNRMTAKRDFTLNLGGNPFLCTCESEYIYKFALNRSQRILDTDQLIVNCSHIQTKSLIRLKLEDFCELELSALTIGMVSIAVIICVFCAVTATFYAMYSDSILVWIYSKEFARFLFDDELIDSDKPYDAFISYSHHDSDFVNELLLPGLEAPEDSTYKYRCLTHEKDWLVGQPIPDNILNSVQSSRRTIIVLSKNFIKSMWSTLEFQAAHTQALQDKTQRVVIILRGELPDESAMPQELRNYIKLNTYIESESPWFWERLRYALPHRGSGGILSARRRRKRTRRETDQLELMKAAAEAEFSKGGRTPSPPTISAMVDGLNGDNAAGNDTRLVIGGAKEDITALPSVNYSNGHANGSIANGNPTLSNGNSRPTSNGVGGGMHSNGGFNLNDSGRQVRKIITAQS